MMLGGGAGSGGSVHRSASVADATISSMVERKYAADGTLNDFNLIVRTVAGKVTVLGIVDNYAARERAEKLAIAIDGVKAVDNQIKVEYRK